MSFLRDCYVAITIVVSLFLLSFSIFTGLKAGYYETSRSCSMSWSRPQFTEITDLINVQRSEIDAVYPSAYKMFHHFQDSHAFVRKNGHLHKQQVDRDTTSSSNIDTVIVYIPGQSGSYLQIRSIASRILHHKYLLIPQNPDQHLNNHHENMLFLTFDFGEEWSSISSQIIARQTAFVYMMLNEYLCYNLSLISDAATSSSLNIVFIGHSMGGIVTRSLINILSKSALPATNNAPLLNRFNANFLAQIRGVIFVSTPLWKPVLRFENTFDRFHAIHSRRFNDILRAHNIKILSISGGVEDMLIEPYLSQIPAANDSSIVRRENIDFIVSNVCPTIMNTMDHQATVWCHAMTETISKYICDMLDEGKEGKEAIKNEFLSPYIPDIADAVIGRDGDDDSEGSAHFSFGNRLTLRPQPSDFDFLVVISCTYAVQTFDICKDTQCIDMRSKFRIIPAWTSHANDRYNFSLDHTNHAFLPRFMAVISSKDLPLQAVDTATTTASYIQVNGTRYNKYDTCVLWQGRARRVQPSDRQAIPREFGSIQSVNRHRKIALQSNRVHIDSLRLSPLLYHDIKFVITPPTPPPSSSSSSPHICVSGVSGKINPPLNGVYRNTSTPQMSHMYAQEMAYWYSPWMKIRDRQAAASAKQSLPLFYIYQHRELQKWIFSNRPGTDAANAFCDESTSPPNTTHTPLQCAQWNILEFNLNDPAADGWKSWRQRVMISMTKECSPSDVAMLHVTNDAHADLLNEWVALSTVHERTVHRTIVPRVSDKFEIGVDAVLHPNQLRFEWFLFDRNPSGGENENDAAMFIVEMEYNYLSTLINTAIRDFAYFPFVTVMTIWFGMLGEMYGVEGIQRVNFYMVAQTVLMLVSCLDWIPLNEHWKYIGFAYANKMIHLTNFGPYLLEFVLPYIYFSSAALLMYSLAYLLRVLLKDIMFGVVRGLGLNRIFVIPFSLFEYSVYATVILYGVLGFIISDLNVTLKQTFLIPRTDNVEVEVQYVIITLFGVVLIWNLLKRIIVDRHWFGFYETCLCILLVFTRWNILFGVIEKQQFFELIIISMCLLIIRFFELAEDLSKYSANFHAKALLSLSSQIFILQQNIYPSILAHKFVLTPLMQSMISWSVSKIIITRFL